MEKMERKKTVLLSLIADWEKLCKKFLSKQIRNEKVYKVKKNPYSFGYISGELKAIEIMKQLIEEAWRR